MVIYGSFLVDILVNKAEYTAQDAPITRPSEGVTDGRTGGRTDGRTDRRTGTPSYRDASAHLKKVQEYAMIDTLERDYFKCNYVTIVPIVQSN